MPSCTHPDLWNAIYHSGNWHGRRGWTNQTVKIALQTFRGILTGSAPRLWQLTNWVGHGFGYEGTRASISKTPGTSPGGGRKKALVPGCGYGCDAVCIAKLGEYDVVGLDISSQAIWGARDYLRETDLLLSGGRCPSSTSKNDHNWAQFMAVSPGHLESAGGVKFIEGDFFSDDWLEKAGTEKFDLIYDCLVSLLSASCALFHC